MSQSQQVADECKNNHGFEEDYAMRALSQWLKVVKLKLSPDQFSQAPKVHLENKNKQENRQLDQLDALSSERNSKLKCLLEKLCELLPTNQESCQFLQRMVKKHAYATFKPKKKRLIKLKEKENKNGGFNQQDMQIAAQSEQVIDIEQEFGDAQEMPVVGQKRTFREAASSLGSEVIMIDETQEANGPQSMAEPNKQALKSNWRLPQNKDAQQSIQIETLADNDKKEKAEALEGRALDAMERTDFAKCIFSWQQDSLIRAVTLSNQQRLLLTYASEPLDMLQQLCMDKTNDKVSFCAFLSDNFCFLGFQQGICKLVELDKLQELEEKYVARSVRLPQIESVGAVQSCISLAPTFADCIALATEENAFYILQLTNNQEREELAGISMISTREKRNRSLQAGHGLQIVFSGRLDLSGPINCLHGVQKGAADAAKTENSFDFAMAGKFGASFMTITRSPQRQYELHDYSSFMFQRELQSNSFNFIVELEPEKYLFVPESFLDEQKMVMLDVHEVNLSTFGQVHSSEIALGKAKQNDSTILDVLKAPDFNLSKGRAYLFLRFNDSISVLNLSLANSPTGGYILTKLTSVWLTPLPLRFAPGSILAARLENNSYLLFTLETFTEKQMNRTKMLSINLDCEKLTKIERKQALSEESVFDVPGENSIFRTQIVIRPLIFDSIDEP